MIFFLRLLLKLLKYLFYLFIILVLVLAIWWLGYRVYKHQICAEFPNGLIAGWNGLFDRSNYLWAPSMVLKRFDGSVLVRDNIDTVYFSETTIFGETGPRLLSEREYKFVYRNDTGLVFEYEEPEKYQKLVDEAGDLIWVYGRRSDTNLWGAYLEMIKDPGYRRTFCPLPIFPRR